MSNRYNPDERKQILSEKTTTSSAEWIPWIITMHNTMGKLMERIIARELVRYLQDNDIESTANRGGFKAGNRTWGNAAAFVCIYNNIFVIIIVMCMKDSRGENKQWLQQSMWRTHSTANVQGGVAVWLVQYEITSPLTHWIAGVIPKRIKNPPQWSCSLETGYLYTLRYSTMGLPQGAPLQQV